MKKICNLCKKEIKDNAYICVDYQIQSLSQCNDCFNKYDREETKQIIMSGWSTKEWEERIYNYFNSNAICDLLDLAIIKYGNQYLKSKKAIQNNKGNMSIITEIYKLICIHTMFRQELMYRDSQILTRIHTWYCFYFKPKFYKKLGA